MELRREPAVEPVTLERIAETAGSAKSPFAGSLPCTVYVVPLDTASEERANEVARRLTELPVQPCALPATAVGTGSFDAARGQLDATTVTGALRDLFVAEWGEQKSTVIGVTEHDLFSPEEPGSSHVFGWSLQEDAYRRGFAVVSTARLGSGDDLARRLHTLAVRYVGLGYFGLELDSEPASALWRRLRTRGDLDRMAPQLGDPALSHLELRHARASLLAG